MSDRQSAIAILGFECVLADFIYNEGVSFSCRNGHEQPDHCPNFCELCGERFESRAIKKLTPAGLALEKRHPRKSSNITALDWFRGEIIREVWAPVFLVPMRRFARDDEPVYICGSRVAQTRSFGDKVESFELQGRDMTHKTSYVEELRKELGMTGRQIKLYFWVEES